MKLQSLRDADVAAIKDLIAEGVLELYGDLDWLPKTKDALLAHYEKVGYLKDIDDYGTVYAPGNGLFLVLTEGGSIRGCGGIKRFHGTDGELVRLWIRKEMRGMGHGRAIFDALMEASRSLGFHRLFLDTSHRCGDALRLFRRNGFTDCAPYKESIGDIFLSKPLISISPCGDPHKAPILEILNDAIANTTALYDYQPRTLESMDPWFAAKRKGGFPVVGAFDDKGKLLGFGSYGTFRNWPAYKYSVEHSIYVDQEARGRGIGKRLLLELIARAEQQGFHTLIGGIDSENEASLGLHEKLGFSRAGIIRHAGFKFGRWLDLVFVQKILSTPADPKEE